MHRLVFPALAAVTLAACELVAGIGDVTVGHDASTGGDAVAPDAHDGGLDGDGLDADATPSACPGGDGSAPMVEITVASDGGRYCIDPFEVTRGQLNAFLQTAASQPPFSKPAFCATAQVGARPAQETNPASLSLPATSVEWCYAYTYCAWRGKRLCGKIGGGESVQRAWQEIDLRNQWDYACVNGLLDSQYTYGQPYDPAACNTEADASAPVGSHALCHGAAPPFTGIFDLTGNVAELDDMASEHAANPQLEIGAHGGTFAGGAGASKCGSYFGFGPYVGFDNVGFRCCADVTP